MTTGYNARVLDGRTTTLRDYALQCARAMGPLVSLRDKPQDLPLTPETILPDVESYYARQFREASEALARLEAMTDAEYEVEMRAEDARALEGHTIAMAKVREELRRCETMIALVAAWTPPSAEHLPLKEFMLGQLTTEVPSLNRMLQSSPPVMRDDAAAARMAEIDLIASWVARSKERLASEASRERFNGEWLQALLTALPEA
jgi:hypothetical protein